MDILFPFFLLVALFLALQFLWGRSTWRHSLADGGVEGEGQPEAPAEIDPYALPFVQHRLDVLAAELDRLECDHSIFARAFRVQVAQSAYDALLADASRLANASRISDIFRPAGTTAIEIEVPRLLTPLREELDV